MRFIRTALMHPGDAEGRNQRIAPLAMDGAGA